MNKQLKIKEELDNFDKKLKSQNINANGDSDNDSDGHQQDDMKEILEQIKQRDRL